MVCLFLLGCCYYIVVKKLLITKNENERSPILQQKK
jgi:hypothetical protein